MIISKAIMELRPNSKWYHNSEGLHWLDENQTKPTETEIQAKIAELEAAEPVRLLRQERNRRLADTDWTQSRDVILENDAEWKTYRQALRDYPATANPQLDENGMLTNVTWPEVPE